MNVRQPLDHLVVLVVETNDPVYDNAKFRRKALDEDVSEAHYYGRRLREDEIAASGAVGVEVDSQGELVAVVSHARSGA